MLEAQLQALFELYGEKMVQDMRTKMAEDGSTASGQGSVSLEAISQGGSLTIIGNDYIEQISEGRRPGPIDDAGVKRIQEWVKIKGLSPNKPNIRYKDLAYLVARKVRTTGFVGTGLFQYVIEKNIVPLSEDVADVVLEVVGEQLDQTIRANFINQKIGTAV